MRKACIILCFFLTSIGTFGQKYTEIGMNFGLAGVQGEMIRYIDPWVMLYELRPSLGAELRHYFSPRQNLYTTVRVVHLHAADKNYGFDKRGYLLNANLTTVDLRYEFNLRPYSRNQQSLKANVDNTWWTPYIGFGGSGLYYNPNIQYPDPELPDEISNRVGFSGAVHYALGIKFDLPRGLGMACEINHHYTFTDRIDAFPREDSFNDWYYQATVSFYILLIKRGYF